MAGWEHRSGGEPIDTSGVLSSIDSAIDETAEWLQKWHRSVICNEAADQIVVSEYSQFLTRFGSWMDLNRDRGLLDQSAFRSLAQSYEAMHEFGRFLAQKAALGTAIPTAEYDAFTEKIQRFNLQARRIREAFRMAVSELDPLTGLQNRQVMMQVLERERERALRAGTPCCIVLADIDHFKLVNDTHGHPAGDHVLRMVAGRFLSKLRPYDEIFRYGGEEFLICLPSAGDERAIEIVERLRLSLADQPILLPDGTALPLTASFGLCLADESITLKQTIEFADEALYAAKSGGRNRVQMWRNGPKE
ncbi:MAG: diguanylate cyclase [Alphaproteobacteria bacterium]